MARGDEGVRDRGTFDVTSHRRRGRVVDRRPCSARSPVLTGEAASRRRPPGPFAIEVVSSAPDQVSAATRWSRSRSRRRGPGGRRVELNGTDVTSRSPAIRRAGLVGLVEGCPRGAARSPSSRLLAVRSPARTAASHQPPDRRPDLLRPAAAAVRVHDGAGEVRRPQAARPAARRQPGPLRHPRRGGSADGSYPQDGRGYPTAEAEIVGWSGNCAAETRFGYLYRDDRRRLPLARRSRRSAARRHRHDDDARRHDGALRRPLGARHDQPLHLQRRDARPGRPRPTRRAARRLAVERAARLQLPGRRRDRALPGDHEHRRDAAGRPARCRATAWCGRAGPARTRTTTCRSAARPR